MADVSKYYGRKQALRSVSFSLDGGRVVVLGPNGSGKTTLMKIMAGLILPDRGKVKIFDETLVQGHESFRSRIGYLSDQSAHWEALTGWENAFFFARSFGIGRERSEERMAQMFEQLNMSDVKDDPVSSYSYGMRRKLALIQTMVHNPDILLLDEPSIGLDLSSRSSLYRMLEDEAKRGSTVVISTNDINEARHIADEVLLISEGRLLVAGSPADLIHDLAQNTSIEIELGVPAMPDLVRRLPRVLSANSLESEGKHYIRILVRSDEEEEALSDVVRHLAMSNYRIRRISVRRPELDDVFLKFTEG